ncbi:hypothetical protein [Brachyspira murdochii]|uniref:Lipoprotein n=1 Tax=Brachyspira murdochii (strain ATCC 51284 / DSM 12563 / 56-150) TaxID=526224 RepID=D5U5C2_BRAM5|nr:hypothetical protein [Brachyspira murdochii]ADG70389.1 conserved hypothetical protein [Brachyspira murdochii DSM 12563]
MKKIFLLITIMSLIIIQCGNKSDNQTTSNNNVNTNETVQSNETILGVTVEILSQADEAFLEKVKNKIIISGSAKYTFKDNGDIEYVFEHGKYREDKNYIFESSKDGTNAYYYELYNIQDKYEKGPSNIAANYKGFSVKNGILYEDNYQGYESDPNETIMSKWEKENYYSNYYYREVKENPNFDNFPYDNKADVTFDEYNRISRGILISESDYKPEEVGDINNYNFDGVYSNNNSSIELKKNDDGTFYFYAINITTDENGQTVTNIQSTDTDKMVLSENQYVEPYCGIGSQTLDYEEVVGADGGYIISIQPISADTIMVTEPNGSYGFTGIYKKAPEIINDDDKSTKEKAYYNACRWYAENYSELNDIFNKIVDFDFEGGGYYEINMENVYLYIAKFENSGYFSDNYIKNLENRFEEIKNYLEENKQNDGAVEGMEADWFLAAQEIDYYLNIITNEMTLKDIVNYDGDSLCISNEAGESVILEVKKYGDEWLIEK